MKNAMDAFFNFLVLLIGVAIIAMLISSRANTVNVINSNSSAAPSLTSLMDTLTIR